MAEKQFLTKKGYDERVARLEELKVVRRKEVAQKLKEAREQGDLSENAEYDAAKDCLLYTSFLIRPTKYLLREEYRQMPTNQQDLRQTVL